MSLLQKNATTSPSRLMWTLLFILSVAAVGLAALMEIERVETGQRSSDMLYVEFVVFGVGLALSTRQKLFLNRVDADRSNGLVEAIDENEQLMLRPQGILSELCARLTAAGVGDNHKVDRNRVERDVLRTIEGWDVVVRYLALTLPALGLLGTGLGIIEALGGLGTTFEVIFDAAVNAKPNAQPPRPQGLFDLLNGVSYAFETTVVGVALGPILLGGMARFTHATARDVAQGMVDQVERYFADLHRRRRADTANGAGAISMDEFIEEIVVLIEERERERKRRRTARRRTARGSGKSHHKRNGRQTT